nr:MBL fold metallo-hydrolase [Fredinandcohnia onubensis]
MLENIKLVGSGSLGFEISHPSDCNVYVVNCGDQYVLIDAGCGINTEKIEHNLIRHNIPLNKISYLFLTHSHGDHAGGASFFQDKYGINIVAPLESSTWLEVADREKTSINLAIKAGLYPQDYKFEPIRITKKVSEGELLQIGNITFHVIETPGHSDDHLSYLIETNGKKVLFAGDSIFAGGKIVLQNIWDCSIQKYAKTIEKLQKYKIDSLYSGHGVFLQSRAYEHINQAHDCFVNLKLPPNL